MLPVVCDARKWGGGRVLGLSQNKHRDRAPVRNSFGRAWHHNKSIADRCGVPTFAAGCDGAGDASLVFFAGGSVCREKNKTIPR
jgi:hypothetical protein